MAVDHQELYKHGPHPPALFFVPRHVQFFHLYEVVCVFGTPIYNSSTSTRWSWSAIFVMMPADHMCGDGRRPSRIVKA